jgi:ribokinase
VPRAALIGNLVKDVVAGGEPRPGGALFYQAGVLARLGLGADLVLVTRCAEEDRLLLLEPLEALGLPTVWQPAAETQSFGFHYEGERRVMDVLALGDPWTPDDVAGWVGDALGDAEWVMLGAHTKADFTLETLAALRANGRLLLLDGQGLVREGSVGPLRVGGAVPAETFAAVRALKLSDTEAELLAGGLDARSIRALCVPEVVVTLGSRGALIVTAALAEEVPGLPVAGVDPTGAGDAFWAAYLSARADGVGPIESARQASAFVSGLLAARG